MDQSPCIVILDRCTSCVTSKQSSHYCRLSFKHTAARAMPCIVCSNEQLSMNECRMRWGHKEPNTSTIRKTSGYPGLFCTHYKLRSGKFVPSRGVSNRECSTKSGTVIIDGQKMR